MKSIISLMAALLLVLICAGCGQSGPLYVPGDPSSINMPPETESSDEESDDGEEDDSQ